LIGTQSTDGLSHAETASSFRVLQTGRAADDHEVVNWLAVIHPQERNMNFIIWIVVGGIIGWLASMVMRTNAQQGVILNIVVGIVGAMLGGWLIAPLLGQGTINSNDFSLGGLAVSFIGALILLAIVNLVRRGSPR
jgi:uncharacterized membrane protein YeaQ/YmgE (transglycosylase-associated protein family)